MPDSCAKALAPTIALLGCTVIPVRLETSLEVFVISSVLMAVRGVGESGFLLKKLLKKLFLTWRAITNSSREAFPALSPIPLMVHSSCLAPFFTASRKLATAKPKSLWPWTEITASSIFGTFLFISAISLPNSLGVVTVSYTHLTLPTKLTV